MHTTLPTLLICDRHTTVLGPMASRTQLLTGYEPHGWQPRWRAAAMLAFNGQLLEATGRYSLGHGRRVYDPALRRFHQPDRRSPFGPGGLNAYAYCLGDPVNYQDPSGEVADWERQYLIPALGMSLSAVLFMGIGMPALVNKPSGLMLAGVRATLVGAPISIIASSLVMAGKGDEAAYVAMAGTSLSILGASARLAVFLRGFAAKTNRLATLGAGVKWTLGIKPGKVGVASPKSPVTFTSPLSSPKSMSKAGVEQLFVYSPALASPKPRKTSYPRTPSMLQTRQGSAASSRSIRGTRL
jgi:RHS repeat-associated protein